MFIEEQQKAFMSKKIPLTIYLSKEGLSPDDCFDFQDKKKPEKFDLEIESFEGAVGYVDISKPKDPPWVDFFKRVTGKLHEKRLQNILTKTQSLSAIVAVKHSKSDRCFIICFGYGKKYLDEDCYERVFGRNLVLNTADENKVISLRTRSYEGVPWYKEYQSFLSNKLSDFEFNCDYEQLQKITADYEGKLPDEFKINVPSKTKLGKNIEKNLISFKIAGFESIKINANIAELKLGLLLDWLEDNFKKTRFKDLVKNIDSFQPMKSDLEISVLNDILLEKIILQQLEDIHLVVPEKIDPEKLTSFGISKTIFIDDKDRLEKLDFEKILNHLNDSEKLEYLIVQDLKEMKVLGYEGDEFRHSWSLFRCIFAEVEFCDEKFTLIDGEWFSIDSNLYNQMKSKVNSCIRTGVFDPFDKKVHKDENGYNIETASSKGMMLFDRDLIQPSVKGEIEACDILDSDRLIHVKRFRSSACLSHLFFQSYVSQQLLLDDETFLENFKIKIEKKVTDGSKALTNALKKRDHTVVLAIIFETKQHSDFTGSADALPIFSLITISKTIDSLKARGGDIKVEVHMIGAV